MRIGIDFDNTIACYDRVFYTAARERGIIPDHIGTDKNSVRDHLNGSGQKDAFTELQGYVYGSRMDLAKPFPGVAEFVAHADSQGHRLFVVSHKTRHPVLGPKYDMHAAARGFLEANGFVGAGDGQIAPDDVFFAETKEEKIANAKKVGAEMFIDDLPEILAMFDGDSNSVLRVLFDPNDQHPDDARYKRVKSWSDVSAMLVAANT